MNRSLVAPGLQSNQRSRRSRLFRLFAGFVVLAVSAGAQVGISTYAGASLSSGFVNNAAGTSARFSNPKGLAADALAAYVADSANNAVRKINLATSEVTTLATGFNGPSGVAVDAAGNVYVADTLNHVIRKVTPGGTVTVLAGSVGTFAATNGTLAASRFNNPQGIAVNSTGTVVYVGDTGNDLVRRIDVTGDAVTTIATGFKPFGLALNAAGTILYVADSNGHSIRSISGLGTTNTLATVAGTVGTLGSSDGTGTAALFRNPQGLSVDSAGDIYVADTGNSIIRKISGTTVTTIAGTASLTGSTDGAGANARFNGPQGIVATGVNTFYVADTTGQTIRRGAPATAPTFTSAANATFTVNTAGTFTVTANGSPAPSFQVVSGSLPSGITLNSTTGVLSGTPTTSTGSPFTFTIQASNGVGTAPTQSFTLSVVQAPAITSAATTTFAVNSAGSFTVTASGSPAPTFSIVSGSFPPWASFNSSTGVISGTPSDNTGSPFTFTIQASNGVGSAVTQSFSLTVNNGPGITTQPSNSVTIVGQNATFSVAATGTPAPSYQWQREAAAGGGFSNLVEGFPYTGTTGTTLTVSGVTSIMNGDKFRVVVTNGIGSGATSSTVTLTAAQAPVITSASATTFVVNQAGTFTITSTGSPTPSYSVISGSFPPWASLNSTTGVISGTPSDNTGSPFQFTIQATNGVTTAATQNFALTVNLADVVPTITTHPVNSLVQLGQNATFTAAASGTPSPTLRWQRQPAGTSGFVDLSDDSTFSGTTTGTLTVTNIQSGMSGDQYRLSARNTTGGSTTNTVNSNPATLTVNLGTTITTFAGLGGQTGSLDGTGTAARFNTPASIALDGLGNFYVADTANHVIRKITSSGVVTTLAGLAGSSGHVNGTGSAARFNGPSAVAVNSIGTVYVADTYNHVVRVISAAGEVSTLAGSPGLAGSADGTGTDARFSFPSGIVVDSATTIFVADSNNHSIRRVTLAGVVTTFAGLSGASGAVDASGTSARFNFPTNMTITSNGTIYVADTVNHLIRRITFAGDVTTVAGTAGSAGSADGTGAAARFNRPGGVAIDSSGVIYVADTSSHIIRRISTANEVTTLAGSAGVPGTTDGIGSQARFSEPYAIAVDSSGNLYIADTRNHTIRRTGSTSAPGFLAQPQNRVVPSGGTTTFTVTASGSPSPTYQWQRQPSGTFGFVNLAADSLHSGVNSATLTVSNVLPANNGDQYRVVLSNGVSPSAVSNPATLTIGELPVITSAASASVRATEALSFTVTATGSPTPTFTAQSLPSWATLSAEGLLSGTPPVGSEGTTTITITASNGATATQTFTLTVTPAVVPPAIASQPASLNVNQGQTATFSVTATGTAPLGYQWRRNGALIVGATASTYSVANAQAANAGSYSVVVTNAAGSVASVGAELVVTSVPTFTLQPQSQVALSGGTVTFTVGVTGGSAFNYQWRRNGIAIPGATNATLTLAGVSVNDSGNYDVQVSNSQGLVISSLASLNVVTTASAPVFTQQPADRAVLAGGSVVLAAAASGAPSPSYQWRKNGAVIAGATNATLAFPTVQASDGGSYDVVASSASGLVISRTASLRVVSRSFAGTYFGSFGSNLGTFALFIRPDNTGVFLGYLPGSAAPVMTLNLGVGENGTFSFTQTAVTTSSQPGEPARAAALAPVTVSGVIQTNGTLTGDIVGGATTTLSATRSPDAGPSQSISGFYQAGAGTSSAVSYSIAGANGQAFVVVRTATTTDGGTGTASAGQIVVSTPRSVISQSIDGSGYVSGTAAGAVTGSFSGGSETLNDQQRLLNISSRTRVGAADAVAIAGFVISGEVSKPVLIRAVGPTLGAAFNVPGALAAPRLELFEGSRSLAVNTGIGTNRTAIDAAGVRAGAFPLGAAGTDAAIFTTLAPGAYTAVVSSSNNAAGVALIEVYDLSAPTPGQKLLNISTRAAAGVNENTLIAGFVVPPGAAKRVLIRGVGPGLAPFGVTGVLAQPTLTLLNGSTIVAQNTNWNTSTDAAALAAISSQVGAFALANNDSAIVATLAPGNYTAQVLGVNNTTGVALIEVYELP